MSTAGALVSTYSAVGDIFLIVLCLLLLVIVKLNYVRMDYKNRLLVLGTSLLIIAASSNITFAIVAKGDYSDFILYLTRDIYHVVLLCVFVVYVEYMNKLIGLSDEDRKYIRKISLVFCVIASVIDCISPIIKFGFYKDSLGVWHDDSYLKPFTIAYAINMIFIGILIIKYRKRLIRRVVDALIITISLCITMVVIENFRDSNSFLALTFFMPIFVVLFEFHTNAYNVTNGSRDFGAFAFYLTSRYEKKKRTTFLCLKLSIDENLELPSELGKVFYNFYFDEFKNAELFSADQSSYVLAIPDEYENEIEIKLNRLIYEKFPEYYYKYKMNYKILVVPDSVFSGIEKFNNLFTYWANRIELNSVKWLTEEELEKYKVIRIIVNELKDIEAKKDLNDERVITYCQPIKNIKTGKFDTAEALMRLEIPKLGMVYPDEFIPLAEEYGVIHTLSMIILNKTCRTVRELLEDGYNLDRVSVNFALCELIEENFVKDFIKIVDSHKIEFDKIGVELTESQNDKNFDKILNVVRLLKGLNVVIYLDDFGSGYSNFDRILKLKFDVIKMDRSLLLLSDSADDSSSLLDWFSKAFGSMGYKMLYEGVETEEQELKCKGFDADYLQGFKYSRPIPIYQLRSFLEKNE